jgi:hypothetical protein
VLVVTFKPAVEDAWQTDLESTSISTAGNTSRAIPGSDPRKIDRDKPVVYFGSFQDLLGRDERGTSSPRTNGSTR